MVKGLSLSCKDIAYAVLGPVSSPRVVYSHVPAMTRPAARATRVRVVVRLLLSNSFVATPLFSGLWLPPVYISSLCAPVVSMNPIPFYFAS